MCGCGHEVPPKEVLRPANADFTDTIGTESRALQQERANMAKKRNSKAEYARRKANALARGLSVSQARGHAKAGERPSRDLPSQIEDERLQVALCVLRREANLAAAAKAARISPERLRRHVIERGLIEKFKGRWRLRAADLPRRLKAFSREKALTIVVLGLASAFLVGRYTSPPGEFLRTTPG
jgi:hypothetical protein